MTLIMKHLLTIFAGLLMLFIFATSLTIVLKKKDKKRIYSKDIINPYLTEDINSLKIRIPYLFWKVNKRKFIEENYDTEIVIDSKTYLVLGILKGQQHIPTINDHYPIFCYSDYVVKVEMRRDTIAQITNNTNIIGNNNTVQINNSIVGDITQNVNKLLEKDINETDKAFLELFKYKLQDGSADKSFKKRIIKILEKYTPYISLATATINMIKSILS